MSIALRRRQTLQTTDDLIDFLIVHPDTGQGVDGLTLPNLARLWLWLNATSRRQAAANVAINLFCYVALFFAWLGREAVIWQQVVIVSLIVFGGWLLIIDAKSVYEKWQEENSS